ncbi:MAG: VTT domain-containing protein [Chloroflexota bacterium]|nr:VTT domain-containing protein [Chloroflexota bacterium]
MTKQVWRWILLAGIIFAFILIPFLLFGETIDLWTENFIEETTAQPGWVATILSGLLMLDILIPVPSSLVSTAAGFLLGFTRGLLTSFLGMTLSCLLGFWVGGKFGRPLAQRLVGAAELRRLEGLMGRWGDWAIVISRPVPMLAESAVLFAGISQMSISRFFWLASLSNLGISAVYAAVGTFSANVNSFLLAFGGSMLIPGLTMMLMREKQEQ